ncbi:hypothetical protein SAY87_030251 [Trapa incisa]|uniref:Uncharacterized protein n=1 Tax=Trapa incisa TaxID=236973 RepID=A0AAN7KN30_9MYRT|nr:hypothetical protein SAY87_030251 [Trapa incisa]
MASGSCHSGKHFNTLSSPTSVLRFRTGKEADTDSKNPDPVFFEESLDVTDLIVRENMEEFSLSYLEDDFSLDKWDVDSFFWDDLSSSSRTVEVGKMSSRPVPDHVPMGPLRVLSMGEQTSRT